MTVRPPHFDVHQSATANNIGSQGCMFDNLIRRDPRDGGRTIIPDLAHSWEIAKDGKTYTFFLRKGVEFHMTCAEWRSIPAPALSAASVAPRTKSG
jgi:ABC-type transport system substrate-binding protein